MGLRRTDEKLHAGSGLVPLGQAVFQSFQHHELKEADQILLPYKSAVLPKTAQTSVSAQTFRFVFPDGLVVEGKPWDLLNKDDALPRNALAAAFVHKSAGEIWDWMNVHFNGRLAAGAFVLFARPNNFRAEFEAIPWEQWKFYRVTDWETGTAVAPDGCFLFSVHARTAEGPRKTSSGRQPTYDQDFINAVVLSEIKKRGFPRRGGEPGWSSKADVGRLIRAFCFKTKNKEPANSTLQIYARDALDAAKRNLKADN